MLSRWLEGLENYVPPEVVKIVVGNKLNKASPLLSSYPITSRRPLTRDTHSCTHPNPSSNTLDKCPGAAFAARTGCLFVEASAKTAVGVTEAFNEIVARIIDTLSLWNEDKPKSSGRTAPAPANTTSVSGPRRDTGESVPGNIDLSQVQDGDTSAGCLC